MKTRDFTKAEFRAAAKRNGFRVGPFGLEADDINGCSSYSFGYVLTGQKPHRVLRRASLAYAIQWREAEYAKHGRRR